MTERERLIELIKKAKAKTEIFFFTDTLADFLIKKGVIVPPCKMDDKLYTVIYDDVLKEWYISEDIIGEVGKTGLFVSLDAGFFEYIPYSKIGKDYFLNREDAEKALEEMKGEENGK